MPTHAAFLRAVNLGAHRQASGQDLRAAFEELGFEDVATFRNSGNVVFSAKRQAESRLRAAIERGLEQRFGFAVPVYLRSAAQLRELSAESPFGDGPGKLQVALLERAPAAGVREQVLGQASDEDQLAFARRELLWLPSGGTQQTALNLRALEKLLGGWTMRTMGTIEQIVSRHFG